VVVVVGQEVQQVLHQLLPLFLQVLEVIMAVLAAH
jgi:hypothetical protein